RPAPFETDVKSDSLHFLRELMAPAYTELHCTTHGAAASNKDFNAVPSVISDIRHCFHASLCAHSSLSGLSTSPNLCPDTAYAIDPGSKVSVGTPARTASTPELELNVTARCAPRSASSNDPAKQILVWRGCWRIPLLATLGCGRNTTG